MSPKSRGEQFGDKSSVDSAVRDKRSRRSLAGAGIVGSADGGESALVDFFHGAKTNKKLTVSRP